MRFLKNVSYTISSNLLSILTSAIVVLVIPRFIGVHEYGLWQIFIFYAGYVGILHLGWADGLFLRRGGQHIEDIDSASLKAESLFFIVFNVLVGLLLIIIGLYAYSEYKFILVMLGITVIVANVRTWITMILQAIGDFKGYAINLSVQSLTYLLLIVAVLTFHLMDYRYMIMAFVISQLVTSVSGFVQLKKIFPRKSKMNFIDAKQEIKKNIGSGFKLMIANSTAILIIGVIRIGIQKEWSVSVFGKVSLILSIANLITVFINAVSLVLFPTLRRANVDTSKSYVGVRSVLMPFLYITMFFYFPIQLIIPFWLPKYADVMQYIAILVPMMVYQGKFEILSNTYMKNLRMESTLMIINIITLLVSIVLTLVSTYVLHMLELAIFSIAIVMGVRSILAEVILSKKIHANYLYELIFENIFIIGFMFFAWILSMTLSLILYLIVMIFYLKRNYPNIKKGLFVVKSLAEY